MKCLDYWNSVAGHTKGASGDQVTVDSRITFDGGPEWYLTASCAAEPVPYRHDGIFNQPDSPALKDRPFLFFQALNSDCRHVIQYRTGETWRDSNFTWPQYCDLATAQLSGIFFDLLWVDATPLGDSRAIVAACRRNDPRDPSYDEGQRTKLIGRTTIIDFFEPTPNSVMIEYPIRTINIQGDDKYQVDAGPILFPLSRHIDRPGRYTRINGANWLFPGWVAYNQASFSVAEFLYADLDPCSNDPSFMRLPRDLASHITVKSEVFAVRRP